MPYRMKTLPLLFRSRILWPRPSGTVLSERIGCKRHATRGCHEGLPPTEPPTHLLRFVHPIECPFSVLEVSNAYPFRIVKARVPTHSTLVTLQVHTFALGCLLVIACYG